ncbi:hypothetical protein BDR07DRAFT_1502531 [Suillus spraguei]|nr:hypothetical protein BDR07DRAFT_1502531 [Suillus spraguei]
MLMKDAGVENVPILIQPVHEALLRTLRDLTSAAPADLNTFLNEIKNVNIDTLQEKVRRMKERKEAEKAQNVCITGLESRQDPIEVLRLQMQQMSIGANVQNPEVRMPQRTIGNPINVLEDNHPRKKSKTRYAPTSMNCSTMQTQMMDKQHIGSS